MWVLVFIGYHMMSVIIAHAQLLVVSVYKSWQHVCAKNFAFHTLTPFAENRNGFCYNFEANGNEHFESNQESVVNDNGLGHSVAILKTVRLWCECLSTCSYFEVPSLSQAANFPSSLRVESSCTVI